MSDASTVLEAVSKKVEAVPFYIWNILGIGLFILYANAGYSISTFFAQYSTEIIILISILLSSIVQIILIVFIGAVKRIRGVPDLELHQEFVLAGIISLSVALLLYSFHRPFEVFTFFGGLFLFIVSLYILIFE